MKTLEIETRDRVATVWLNRPEVHNAFDENLIRDLTQAFEQLDSDDGVRVVILAGRGKSFSAGADLNWMQRAAGHSAEENLRDARALAWMLKTIHRLSKPTIARVHGAALGGGVGLTAACDIAIASVQAAFAATEVRFGLIPATIGPYVVAAIGAHLARRYFLSGERFDAAEAYRIGMVHEVCAPDALDDRINEIADALMTGGPKAQTAAKELIRALADRSIGDALIEDTARRIAELRGTKEAREGIAAFLEKRKPGWVVR